MTLDLTIDDRDIQKLIREFNSLDMEGVIERVIPFASKMTQTRMAVYPPPTEGNRPGPYPHRWYQRLVGPRWALKGGGTGGVNTSEQLQQRWRTKRIKPLETQVFTDHKGSEVSYVEHVQSEEQQTPTHAQHGWQTDAEVAKEVEESPQLDRVLSRAIDRELRSKLGV